ncbi:MAG: trimethylamine methyltransferase family protein [Halodesulfurarchaeum sp.]|nr:trimethylamine methyltransferase family protein [Halodesulfurarchaeum sp.]
MDLLSSDARRTVHEGAIELLSEHGMRVEHETARDTLAAAGATVDGEVVTIGADLVEEAIDTAPGTFRWRARDPEKSVTVGTGEPVIAPTRGPRYVKRPGEARHRATMDDFQMLVKLAHEESEIDVVGYDLTSPEGYSLPGNPGGLEVPAVGYELLEGLFTGTDKPIVGSARSGGEAAASLEMARIAFDEAALSEPTVLAILCLRSPRLFNEPIVDGMLQYARAGQPLVVSSGAIPGASAPHSLAETAVQATAESLFGVTLVQLVNPGTPVVFGRASTMYDRNAEAVSAGIPGSTLQRVMIEMATFYGLPSRGHGAATDAKAIDEQSGAESMHHLAAGLDSGADLLLNATGGLDTFGMVSPEKTVLDAERIRLLRAATSEARALRERLESGSVTDSMPIGEPRDPFFDGRDPGTLPDAPVFEDTIGIRGSHDAWTDAGEPSIADRATERVEQLLAAYERPPIDSEIAEKLAAQDED